MHPALEIKAVCSGLGLLSVEVCKEISRRM